MSSQAQTKKPLSRTLKTFWGVGDLGFSLMTSANMYYLNFFLTDVARMPLGLVAVVSTLPAVVDAIFSPTYGAAIEMIKPMRWGKLRSWLIATPWLLLILYPLQYSFIGSFRTAAIIITTAAILAKPILGIPFNANYALVPEIASTQEEIVLLNSRRSFWQSWSRFIWSAGNVAVILFIKRITGNEALGYTGLVFICTLCMVIGYFVHFKMTESYEKLPEQDSVERGPAKRKQKASFSDLVQTLVKNPALLVFLIGDFGFQLSGFIGTATIAYVFTYVIENFGLMSVSMTLSAVVTMSAALFTPLIAKKLDSRRIMLLGAFLGAGITFSRVFLWSNPWLFIIVSAAAAIPTALTNISKQSIYADLAVLGEYKTGQDVKGFVIGLQTVPLKWASMARTIAITAGLALIGYTAGTAPTPAIKNGLVMLSIVVPAIGMFFCGLVVFFFVRLPKEKVLEMKQEIAERKAAAS